MLFATLPLAIAGTSLLHAQSTDGAVDIHPNPVAALRSFEPPAGEAYQLGRGDEISLDFPGRIELSGKRIIGPDGRITLPLAGSILVADQTREEAAAAIVNALAPFYTNLSVTVGVDKYTSNRILLLGAVEHPGILTFDTPPTLLEVVSRGGALPSFASQQGQQKMPAVPERCAIYRGSDKVMWVDLKGLLDSGDALADLRLRRDDVVYIPSMQDRYVSVLGQVQHPGALQLESNSTLAKLIAQAGGLTEGAGRYPDIRVISPTTGTTRVISFKSVLQPASLDLTLKPGDIIFVPQSGFNRVSYVLEKLSPLVSIFTAFAFLEQ
jgi:polysaccharide export outer membrane protein